PLPGALHGREIEEPDSVRKVAGEIARALQRALGLAHAAGADDGYRAVAIKQLRQTSEVALAPNQRLDAGGQPRGKRSRKAQAVSEGHRVLPLHRPDVAVTGTVHSLDVFRLVRIVTEGTADERDTAIQRRRGDVAMAPHCIEDLVARDQCPGPRHQLHEDGQGPGLQRDLDAAARESPIGWIEVKVTAPIADRVQFETCRQSNAPRSSSPRLRAMPSYMKVMSLGPVMYPVSSRSTSNPAPVTRASIGRFR